MVEIVREIPWSELETMLRTVPLKASDAQGNQVFPYKSSPIELRCVSTGEISPTTFYLIKKHLEFQERLREELLTKGYDTLQLKGGLEIVNQTGEQWRIIPPVVEVMHERVVHLNHRGDISYDGKPTEVAVHIINDGAHRVFLARSLGIKPNVVHVTGISAETPFYALPNSWDDVKLFDATPKTMEEKKFYRRKENYALYRDFGVLGIGTPRNTGDGTKVK